MGTNYYMHTKPPCECCGREFEDSIRHIGKSSWGWMFSLHVYPEEGITSLEDWKELLNVRGHLILNEYGEAIPVKDLLNTITNRSKPYNDYYRGKHTITRHPIDYQHCIGHGEGDWDYIIGDFS